MATKKACVDAPKRSRSPVVLEAEMFSEFQDWCLRTYGDSGKTKTVTRRKYNKIMQTLLQNDESDGVYIDNSHINAKFKFWVKSKGFQVGTNVLGEHNKKGAPGKPVLYVPVKSTVKCVRVFLSVSVCGWVRAYVHIRCPVNVFNLSLFRAAHTQLPHKSNGNLSVFRRPGSPSPFLIKLHFVQIPTRTALLSSLAAIATPVPPGSRGCKGRLSCMSISRVRPKSWCRRAQSIT